VVVVDREPRLARRLPVEVPVARPDDEDQRDGLAADVEADTEWFRTRWSDVVAEYDYDVRNIYLEATPEDLAVFNRTHPDVLEHASRVTAYEEQVCEAG
jgi:hypothetical protein